MVQRQPFERQVFVRVRDKELRPEYEKVGKLLNEGMRKWLYSAGSTEKSRLP